MQISRARVQAAARVTDPVIRIALLNRTLIARSARRVVAGIAGAAVDGFGCDDGHDAGILLRSGFLHSFHCKRPRPEEHSLESGPKGLRLLSNIEQPEKDFLLRKALGLSKIAGLLFDEVFRDGLAFVSMG
jgi:hypothetical protein